VDGAAKEATVSSASPLLDPQGSSASLLATKASVASSALFHTHSNSPANGRTDFHEQLAAIRHDPRVERVVRSWAGAPDLAEDILQATYYGLAALKHPELIDNLYAYFLKALKNEVSRPLRGTADHASRKA
jgi:hypothetical protein